MSGQRHDGDADAPPPEREWPKRFASIGAIRFARTYYHYKEAVVVLVLVGAPRFEHLVGERDAFLAEGLLLAQSVGMAAEVTLDV